MMRANNYFGFYGKVWEWMAETEPITTQQPVANGGVDAAMRWTLDFTDSMREFEAQHEIIFGEDADVSSKPDDYEWATPNELWKLISLKFDTSETEKKLQNTEFVSMTHFFGMGTDEALEMHSHYLEPNSGAMGHYANYGMWRNLMEYPDLFGFQGRVWTELVAAV